MAVPMANGPPFATLNHVAADLGIPNESEPLRVGISECFLDRRFQGGAAQAQTTQLLNHSVGLLACCREVLAGVDRLMRYGIFRTIE